MTQAGPAGETRRTVTFRVDDQTFGLDVRSVREIKGWQATTPLPNAPPNVRGVLNLRGIILPVYDLRSTIGHGPTQATSTHVILVVDVHERTIGLLVDTVLDIVDVPPDSIRPKPDVETDQFGLLEGLALLADDIVALIDVSALIRHGDGAVDTGERPAAHAA
jgi:purine-binding chemotaxis protein CheW